VNAVGVGPIAGGVDDQLWSAIGDPTRRRLIDLLLADGPSTATALSAQVAVTRQAVTKHLVVLDQAALVRSSPHGRERRYRVDEAQLARALAQLTDVRDSWDRRLNRLKRLTERLRDERADAAATDARLPTDADPAADTG
jgi:DNA-binding transcriptional ArsR family regulator